MSDQTPTPRTDDAQFGTERVIFDLARELERELAAAISERDEVRRERDGARDERGTCSVQRVGRLLARWRERADRLQKMALKYEEEDDYNNAIDCASAAQEIRDCALDLETEMAGEEPTSR